MNNRSEIEWAPRVSLYKIRAFYLNEARGLLDDELIGNGLYFRCESILEYTEALHGRVKYLRCANSGRTTIIERKTKTTTEMIKCPVCSWQVRWRVYVNQSRKTRGQLEAGHAFNTFRRYVDRFPKCRSSKEINNRH